MCGSMKQGPEKYVTLCIYVGRHNICGYMRKGPEEYVTDY